jgi:hypothetical protein
MTEKRLPTLADRFLATAHGSLATNYLQRPYFEGLHRKVRAAHKFVFDEAAATRIAHVVRDVPELILREHEFARAPFDLTWIEYPHWKFWREVGNDPLNQDATADHTIGYLIDGNMVSVVTGGTVGDPNMAPLPQIFHYYLNTEWPPAVMDEFIQHGGGTIRGLDAYLWGTLKHMDEETRANLRNRYMVALAPIRHDHRANQTRGLLDSSFKGSIGETRNIVTMLLMLNRPTLTRHVGSPPTVRGFIKGKVAPFMNHTRVTIDIDAVPTMRLLGTPSGEGVPRRLHEVRGHFCHNAEAHEYARIAGCQHEWVACDDLWTPMAATRISDANHWVCDVCGGKRWWKHEHERGDRRRGSVIHDDYDVTANKVRSMT